MRQRPMLTAQDLPQGREGFTESNFRVKRQARYHLASRLDTLQADALILIFGSGATFGGLTARDACSGRVPSLARSRRLLFLILAVTSKSIAAAERLSQAVRAFCCWGSSGLYGADSSHLALTCTEPQGYNGL